LEIAVTIALTNPPNGRGALCELFTQRAYPLLFIRSLQQDLSSARNPPRCFTVSQQLAQVGFIRRFQLKFLWLSTAHG
jgi:hypothetical protein